MVIIGGGITGVGIAYFLAKNGVKSTVIERDSIASHASGFAYGGLSGGIPNGPNINTPIIDYSMSLFPSLVDELQTQTGIDLQFRKRDLLRLALSQNDIDDLTKHSNWQKEQENYKVSWLNEYEAKALEPRITDETIGALHVEGSFDVEPYRLTLALAQASEKLGATIKSGNVTAILQENHKILGVRTDKDFIACENVIVAMGPWSINAQSWLNVNIPIKPLKGQIIRLRSDDKPFEFSIGHGKNYAMTKPSDQLVWCGTTEEDAEFEEGTTIAARDQIIDSSLRMLPWLENAELILQTACLRPITPDNGIILGQFQEIQGAYIATGGGRQGIMMGPGISKLLADLIAFGTHEIGIDQFSPNRFTQ